MPSTPPEPLRAPHDPPHRRHWRALYAALLLGVALAALMPGSAAPSLGASDKLDHLLAFVALAFAGAWSGPAGRRRWMFTALWLVAYGAGIELAQTQVPGRDGDWADLATDAVGIAAGLALAGLAHRRWRAAQP